MVFVCCGGVKLGLQDLVDVERALEGVDPQVFKRVSVDGTSI